MGSNSSIAATDTTATDESPSHESSTHEYSTAYATARELSSELSTTTKYECWPATDGNTQGISDDATAGSTSSISAAGNYAATTTTAATTTAAAATTTTVFSTDDGNESAIHASKEMVEGLKD